MNTVKRKIQSNRGASLSFALLLFLVATVVGVSLLQAGTAAAGRVSQLAVSDARYYSVNSAADLLVSQLDGATVRFLRSKNSEVSRSAEIVLNDDGEAEEHLLEEESSEPGYTISFLFADEGEEEAEDADGRFERGRSLLLDLAIDTAFGPDVTDFDSENSEYMENLYKKNCARSLAARRSFSRILYLSAESEEAELETLKVKAELSMKSDGTLKVLLSNAEGGSDLYRLQLTFAVEIRQDDAVSEEIADRTVESGEEGGDALAVEHTSLTNSEEKLTSLCWTLTERKEVDR